MPSPTDDSRLGSMPHAAGVTFRVWAPHADAVACVGSFNDWNGNRHPLSRGEDGIWTGEVSGAKVGDEYRYRLRRGDATFDRIDPRARAVTDSAGNTLVYDPTAFDWTDDDFTPVPANELVIYEMHVGTFNSDDDNPGTFAEAAERLGHLRELGINAVELMPVAEFPGDRSWGYDAVHPYAVETAYGGPDGFKFFVREAHRHGIAVFLDVIYNHFGCRDLHLWRFEGGGGNDDSGKERGGLYFYDDARADTPWGPRPDYSKPEVRDYILENVLMWLREYRLDGLRVDGTYFTRTDAAGEQDEGNPLPEGWELLRQIVGRTRQEFPRAVLIAEDMKDDPVITLPLTEGGAGFHLQWSDRYGHGLRRRANDPDGQRNALRTVRDALPHRFQDDPFRRVIYAESHDNAGKGERILAAADPDHPEGPTARRWLALSAATVFASPGVPLLFQGQELLSASGFSLERADSLDWSRVERFSGILRLHRDLIALRKNAGGVTAGLLGRGVRLLLDDEAAGLLAWHRWRDGGPGDDVLAVANFSGEPRACELGVPSAGLWRVRLNTDSADYGEGLGTVPMTDVESHPQPLHDQPQQIRIELGTHSLILLSRDRG